MISTLDCRVHLLELGGNHPPGVSKARCGHYLVAAVATVPDPPPQTRCGHYMSVVATLPGHVIFAAESDAAGKVRAVSTTPVGRWSSSRPTAASSWRPTGTRPIRPRPGP
jgi:hypothetical protein